MKIVGRLGFSGAGPDGAGVGAVLVSGEGVGDCANSAVAAARKRRRRDMVKVTNGFEMRNLRAGGGAEAWWRGTYFALTDVAFSSSSIRR
jgi:hypothetical protein